MASHTRKVKPNRLDEAYQKLRRLVAAAHKPRERFARPAAGTGG
jgi:hypothetical protein